MSSHWATACFSAASDAPSASNHRRMETTASRTIVQGTVRALDIPCLHVGLAADYAEAIWDERYAVPTETGDDTCDYPLARNTVLLAVALASELVLRFFLAGTREDSTLTLQD